MKRFTSIDGLTIVEIIMTFAILGIVICPLMSMFILSQKINNESEREYKSILQAQKYMEEIQSMESIDVNNYKYNIESGSYEREILKSDNSYSAEISIRPDSDNMLYSVLIVLNENEQVINTLVGTKIFK